VGLLVVILLMNIVVQTGAALVLLDRDHLEYASTPPIPTRPDGLVVGPLDRTRNITSPGLINDTFDITGRVHPIQYHVNPDTGVPDFISFGTAGLTVPESSSQDPVRIALGFFSQYPMVFGTGDVPNQLRVRSVDADVASMKHVVLEQIYGGISVFGAELRVHIRPDYSISSISGNYLHNPGVSLEPTITVEDARDTVLDTVTEKIITQIEPESNLSVISPVGSATIPANETRLSGIRLVEERAGLEESAEVSLHNRSDGILAERNAITLSRDSVGNLTAMTNIRDAVQRQLLSPDGPIIFPGKLSQLPGAQNELAYKFTFPLADIFVSAVSNEIIFVIPKNQEVDRLIYDSLGRAPPVIPIIDPRPALILRNGQIVSPISPNPEILPADRFARRTIGFYADLGRTSYDDRNSAIEVLTNTILASCPVGAQYRTFFNDLDFCVGTVTGDVLAHEFTHGVTATTAKLVYLDESGAVNEHYSDVMGALAFPDNPNVAVSTWNLGERPGVLLRNLQTGIPASGSAASAGLGNNPNNYAAYFPRGGLLGPLGLVCTGVFLPVACDNGFVHTNSQIGNRAAVLLSDGLAGSGHTGIGRDRLAFLFYLTLSTRMHPWSTFIDESLNTWQTAIDLATTGQTVTNTVTNRAVNFNTVEDEVSWAFTQVGVDSRLISGWFNVPGGISPGTGTVTFNAGEFTDPGTTVTNVRLFVTAYRSDDSPYWSDSSLFTAGGTVIFPGGIFGARISSAGIGTSNKAVTVSWFHTGLTTPTVSDLSPVKSWKISVAVAQSGQLTNVIQRQSDTEVHWSDIPLFGGKGDDPISGGKTVSGPGCIISAINLHLLDSDYKLKAVTSPGGPDAIYGGTGARITSHNSGTNDPLVNVHWWFDAGSAVRYKIVYSITGVGCDL
jgi:Thermolysin metallopeptidase, alpha-helical domain/Fungalysin/Thermolysin Propeptide Motif